MAERQSVLKTRLGSDGLRKIGLGSITSNFWDFTWFLYLFFFSYDGHCKIWF